MANTLITSDLVSDTFLARFIASNAFINMGSRGLEGDFTQSAYRPGDTVSIRKRNRLIIGDGQAATAQSITDSVEQVTLSHQYNALVDMTTLEEGYDLDSFTEQVIQPAVDGINAKMNADIYAAAVKQLNYAVGSTSSTLTEDSIFNARAFMRKLQIPQRDRCMIVSPDDAASLNSSLYNTFNQSFNEGIILEGELGQFGGFRMFEDEAVGSFTAGSFVGTPVIAAAPTSGSTTLSLSGFTASTVGVLKAGDVITIASVNSVQPLAYTKNSNLMSFVVQADVTSSGSGTATVTISPAIVWDSTNSTQNTYSQPQVGAAVARIATNTPNIAFCPSALDIVCPPLPRLKTPECEISYDPKYNIAVRLAADSDIYASENVYRIDVLCGFTWHNQYGIRVYSQG